MTAIEEHPEKVPAPRSSRFIRGLLRALRGVFQALACVWATLAIYFSNLPGDWLRLALALAFAIFGVWALWLSRQAKARCVLAGLFVAVFIWYLCIPPSHDRAWRRDVATMPRATIDGDRVVFTGYRNFIYRSNDDFTERYEEREVSLSHLTSADFYISYWQLGPIGHTFLSFNFDNAPPVCISIETRPEADEGFAPLASIFKQFELIYVVGDERDLVRSRTNYRNEEVFLYHLNASPEAARRLFLVYLDRINELADHAEWYHLLKNNCTLNIVRYKNAAGRDGSFDFRHLANGWFDRYLHDAGMVNTTMPFEELRQKSHINKVAGATPDILTAREFSKQIRKVLPGIDLDSPADTTISKSP